MTVIAHRGPTTAGDTARPADDPVFQAYALLRIGFTVGPILFGLDKSAPVLVDGDRSLAGVRDVPLAGRAAASRVGS